MRSLEKVPDYQVEDATGITKVRGDKLDTGYLGKWADELDVTELL